MKTKSVERQPIERQPFSRNLCIPYELAVHVAGLSKTQVRNWLIRDQIYLDANEGREEATHRRFSRLDTVRLGLVARLTSLGYTTKLASAIVETTIYDRILASGILETAIRDLHAADGDLSRALVLKTPESEILKLLSRAAITLWPEQHEPADESDEPLFWATNMKPESDTQIVINIGLMMKKQNERFREMESLNREPL
jgi:hypothetical protein